MVDITMCHNVNCRLKSLCYRFSAEPSKFQSYSDFNLDSDDCFMPLVKEK